MITRLDIRVRNSCSDLRTYGGKLIFDHTGEMTITFTSEGFSFPVELDGASYQLSMADIVDLVFTLKTLPYFDGVSYSYLADGTNTVKFTFGEPGWELLQKAIFAPLFKDEKPFDFPVKVKVTTAVD